MTLREFKNQLNKFIKNNPDCLELEVFADSRLYRKTHRSELVAYRRAYNTAHREELNANRGVYYKKNREEVLEKELKKGKLPTKSKHYLDKLPPSDSPKMEAGFLTVVCTACGRRYSPSLQQVKSRGKAYEGKGGGEHNFYCSDSCKQTCPLFNFHSDSIDPRSKLYVPKTEREKARDCQTDHLKQLQIDEVGHNYCEKCGKEGKVELHHTQEIAKAGMEAVNSAGHILLCDDCHKKFTKNCK